MQKVSLSKIIVPNTDIASWVRDFDNQHQRDYGLEYLIAINSGKFPKIPDQDQYFLPASIDITKGAYELKGYPLVKFRYLWKRGQKTWSIKSLDHLREEPGTPYYINLLQPVSYDGRELKIDGIPLSHPFLKSLAYLAACIICGGHINRLGYAVIHSPRKKNIFIRNKLDGCITSTSKNEKIRFQLKSAYAHLLRLTGVKMGRIVNCGPSEIEVPYLNTLIKYAWANKLTPKDRQHALEVIASFVQGVFEHKLLVAKQGSKVVYLPRFKDRSTARSFAMMFKKALGLVYPKLKYSMSEKIDRAYNNIYYLWLIIIPRKETI